MCMFTSTNTFLIANLWFLQQHHSLPHGLVYGDGCLVLEYVVSVSDGALFSGSWVLELGNIELLGFIGPDLGLP